MCTGISDAGIGGRKQRSDGIRWCGVGFGNGTFPGRIHSDRPGCAGSFLGIYEYRCSQCRVGQSEYQSVPSTDGKLVGKLPKDAACEVIETKDGWCHIKSGEVDGYVSREFLHTGPEATIRAAQLVHTVAIANTDGLNVRQEPNTSSEIVTQVGQGEEMEYVETGADGWVKISIDGEDAYVSQEFVTVEEKLDTAITMTELLYGQGVSDVRVDLVEYAKQFVGNPYVWGGTSLTKGADCSGFVLAVFKNTVLP